VGRITPAAGWEARVTFAGGRGGIEGLAPGAALNASATFSGGAASVPPKALPGAVLLIGAEWSGGAAKLEGGTAPGAAINVSTTWAAGKAQSIGPGAAYEVSAAWVPGVVLGRTATGSNPTNIVIPAFTGQATPYPSTIQVSGENGFVIGATVKLKGLSHSSPGVFTCYVESPSGTTTYLLSDPTSSSVTNLNLTFTSSTTALPPNPLTSGTYRPQAGTSSVAHSIGFGSFVGDDPNGQWKLYAFNRNTQGTSNSISGGWEIEINLGSVYTSSNASSISIPDSGAATPYPSPITISGATGTITSLEVTLNNLTHANAANLQFLLVGPTGLTAMILCNVGGNVSSRTLSFSNLDFKSVSSTLASGSYGLSSNPQQTLPAPAPGPSPYPSSFANFLGTDPNGTWYLYIHDKTAGNSGSLSDGWTLRITTTTS
jgi:subtilisin-like proprotein convertase family protein